MLPESLNQSYQTLFAALDQLDLALEADDPRRLQLTLPNLQEGFSQLMEESHQAIANDKVEPERASRIQSIQTEMNKQLRLLSADAVFLNTAKQPETVQQRRKQIGDRLQSLRKYGEATLSIWNTSTENSESSESDA